MDISHGGGGRLLPCNFKKNMYVTNPLSYGPSPNQPWWLPPYPKKRDCLEFNQQHYISLHCALLAAALHFVLFRFALLNFLIQKQFAKGRSPVFLFLYFFSRAIWKYSFDSFFWRQFPVSKIKITAVIQEKLKHHNNDNNIEYVYIFKGALQWDMTEMVSMKCRH